jgi:hypothetical protein
MSEQQGCNTKHISLAAYNLTPHGTSEALSSFKHYYPEGTIIQGNRYDNELMNLTEAIQWITMVLHSLKEVKEDYILLLHPDMMIVRRFENFQDDLNGNIIRMGFLRSLDLDELVKKLEVLYTEKGFSKESRVEDTQTELQYKANILLFSLVRLMGGTCNFNIKWTHFDNYNPDNSSDINMVAGYPESLSKEFNHTKYTIVLPTRGHGSAFDIFISHLIPRYVKYLKKDKLHSFILICPKLHQNNLKELLKDVDLPLVYYTDEELIPMNCSGWMKQQLIKLAISEKVETEHYLILDDDLILTKELGMEDLISRDGICYSFESWPVNGPEYATNTNWWVASSTMSKFHCAQLADRKDLMGVTPQVMITRVVRQMLNSFGNNDKDPNDWMMKMLAYRATEYTLYWIYLIKTKRTHYYKPDNRLFKMDNECNVLVKGLDQTSFNKKIEKGLQGDCHFIVTQSWLNYPKEWLESCL